MFPLVRELADDNYPVAVTCRVLKVSQSGYYGWLGRPEPPRALRNKELADGLVPDINARPVWPEPWTPFAQRPGSVALLLLNAASKSFGADGADPPYSVLKEPGVGLCSGGLISEYERAG